MKKKMDHLKMINDIQICVATKDHIDGIYEISTLSFPIPWSKKSIEEEIITNNNATYMIAIKNNTIIGYGGVWIILDEGDITNIAIHPKYRGLGIGSIILDSLINMCKNKNVLNMTLEVRKSNIPAQNLYKKFNFVESGIRKNYYTDNKEDALIMWNYNI